MSSLLLARPCGWQVHSCWQHAMCAMDMFACIPVGSGHIGSPGVIEKHFKEKLSRVLGLGNAPPDAATMTTGVRGLMFGDYMVPGQLPITCVSLPMGQGRGVCYPLHLACIAWYLTICTVNQAAGMQHWPGFHCCRQSNHDACLTLSPASCYLPWS